MFYYLESSVITHAPKAFYFVLFLHAGFWVIEKNLSEWREDIREPDYAVEAA